MRQGRKQRESWAEVEEMREGKMSAINGAHLNEVSHLLTIGLYHEAVRHAAGPQRSGHACSSHDDFTGI